MAAQIPPTSPDTSQEAPPTKSGPDSPPERPWRTEGLPKDRSPKSARRWITWGIWVGGYLLLFGILTIQDPQRRTCGHR
jgi:hypothetical protein